VSGRLSGPMLTETDPFDANQMQITFKIYAIIDKIKVAKLLLRYKPRDFQKSNYTLRVKEKIEMGTGPITNLQLSGAYLMA